MDLTPRKRKILKVVTERYIDSAEPVSSKFLAQAMGGGISSAWSSPTPPPGASPPPRATGCTSTS